jgi:hypothetical protein
MAKEVGRRGPKPLPKARKRLYTLQIRFRDDERRALARYARERGLRITDVVRDAVLEKIQGNPKPQKRENRI